MSSAAKCPRLTVDFLTGRAARFDGGFLGRANHDSVLVGARTEARWRPHEQVKGQDALFRSRLDQNIDVRRDLVRMTHSGLLPLIGQVHHRAQRARSTEFLESIVNT